MPSAFASALTASGSASSCTRPQAATAAAEVAGTNGPRVVSSATSSRGCGPESGSRPRPPHPTPSLTAPAPTFEAYASWWLQAKIDGLLGEKPISTATANDYRWRLDRHLLPFFAHHRLDQIDKELCLQFKSHKLREAAELREAIAAGAELRDRLGRLERPLGPSSLRKLSTAWRRSSTRRSRTATPITTRCARSACGSAFRSRSEPFSRWTSSPACWTPRPNRTSSSRRASQRMSGRRPRWFAASSPGLRPTQIAAELGIAKSTVSHHLRVLGAQVGRGYAGRRIVCEILGRSGVRASELCDLRIGQVRLHEPAGARFHISDSKTESGVREVQMSPDLVEAAVTHLDRLRRIGAPDGPDDYLVPNLRGGRISRQRVGQIVGDAARLASSASSRRACRRFPTSRRTPSAAPTSPSPCSPTTSTSSG